MKICWFIDLYYLHGGSGCLEGGKHHTRIIYQMSVTLTITAINILFLHTTLYTLTPASGQLLLHFSHQLDLSSISDDQITL